MIPHLPKNAQTRQVEMWLHDSFASPPFVNKHCLPGDNKFLKNVAFEAVIWLPSFNAPQLCEEEELVLR